MVAPVRGGGWLTSSCDAVRPPGVPSDTRVRGGSGSAPGRPPPLRPVPLRGRDEVDELLDPPEQRRLQVGVGPHVPRIRFHARAMSAGSRAATPALADPVLPLDGPRDDRPLRPAQPLGPHRLPHVDVRVPDDVHVLAGGGQRERLLDQPRLLRPGDEVVDEDAHPPPRPGPKSRIAAPRSSTPSSISTTTPSTRRSSPQTFSTSSASWRPSTKMRLPDATRARCPATATDPLAVRDSVRRAAASRSRAAATGGVRTTGFPSSRKPVRGRSPWCARAGPRGGRRGSRPPSRPGRRRRPQRSRRPRRRGRARRRPRWSARSRLLPVAGEHVGAVPVAVRRRRPVRAGGGRGRRRHPGEARRHAARRGGDPPGHERGGAIGVELASGTTSANVRTGGGHERGAAAGRAARDRPGLRRDVGAGGEQGPRRAPPPRGVGRDGPQTTWPRSRRRG